jgi:hypothetical protein
MRITTFCDSWLPFRTAVRFTAHHPAGPYLCLVKNVRFDQAVFAGIRFPATTPSRESISSGRSSAPTKGTHLVTSLVDSLHSISVIPALHDFAAACARPFHCPPRPSQYRHAESHVA